MYFETILSYVNDSFNFAYVISINIVVYLFIILFEKLLKHKIKKGYKILTTILITICFAFLYHFTTEISNEQLINSSILAPVSWDWIIKPLLTKFKIDYKD